MASSMTKNMIVILTGIMGLVLGIGGIWIAVVGHQAETSITIFGQQVKTLSIGVAIAFLGTVLLGRTFAKMISLIDKEGERETQVLQQKLTYVNALLEKTVDPATFQQFHVALRSLELDDGALLRRISESPIVSTSDTEEARLLDSNVLLTAMHPGLPGHAAAIQGFAKVRPDRCYISDRTMEELRLFPRKVLESHPQGERTRIAEGVEALASLFRTLPLDATVNRGFEILSKSERGRRLSGVDRLIAAQAIGHGMILVTRDRDFSGIDGLTIEDWS